MKMWALIFKIFSILSWRQQSIHPGTGPFWKGVALPGSPPWWSGWGCASQQTLGWLAAPYLLRRPLRRLASLLTSPKAQRKPWDWLRGPQHEPWKSSWLPLGPQRASPCLHELFTRDSGWPRTLTCPGDVGKCPRRQCRFAPLPPSLGDTFLGTFLASQLAPGG